MKYEICTSLSFDLINKGFIGPEVFHGEKADENGPWLRKTTGRHESFNKQKKFSTGTRFRE